MTTHIKKERFSHGTYTGTTISLSVHPEDFLKEAIDDLIKGSADMRMLVNSIIKAAVSAELLMKQKLMGICPALLLEKIDDSGINLARVYEMEDMVRKEALSSNPIKTVRFEILLKRAVAYQVIEEKDKEFLTKLGKHRNAILHHKETIDADKIRILLARDTFPLLKRLIPSDSIILGDRQVWETLNKISNDSIPGVVADMQANFAEHKKVRSGLSAKEISDRTGAAVQKGEGEIIEQRDLLCPACNEPSMAALIGADAEDEGDGMMLTAYSRMECRVCGLILDDDDIEDVRNYSSMLENGEELSVSWDKYLYAPIDPFDV